jgi:cobalt-zinc-cadmium efflux system outer membrane protein
MRSFYLRPLVFAATIAGSNLMGARASAQEAAPLPEPGRFAPAELVRPFLPMERTTIDPSVATGLTLDQALAFADANSPAIQTARAQVGLADAGIIGARIVFPANPEVSFGAGGRTIEGMTGFEFEVAVQQQLEIAGERRRRIDAAQSQRKLGEAVVNEVRWIVHVEVHRLFVDILLARERLRQAEHFVAFAESMRDIAARQVDLGESSPLILLVADTDLAQTREAVIEARQVGEALEARLAAVIGWPDRTLPEVEGALPPVRPAPDTNTLLAMMAEHHPSLRRREIAVAAGRAQLELEEREAWPEPTVGLSHGREAAPGSEAGANVWLFNLTLPIPLWRTNQEGRARAEAELTVADREREAVATRLHGELVQAGIGLAAAVERVALYESGIQPRLEENLALLQRAYELGEVDVHQVSQTRERLLTATGQYIDARIAYHETAATLEGLVGTEIWPAMESIQ